MLSMTVPLFLIILLKKEKKWRWGHYIIFTFCAHSSKPCQNYITRRLNADYICSELIIVSTRIRFTKKDCSFEGCDL